MNTGTGGPRLEQREAQELKPDLAPVSAVAVVACL
jgi:hypothetical protein